MTTYEIIVETQEEFDRISKAVSDGFGVSVANGVAPTTIEVNGPNAYARVMKALDDAAIKYSPDQERDERGRWSGDGVLPMDTDSRMLRAREQGFDTGTKWFHGAAASFADFKYEDTNFGVWITTDAASASGYAAIAGRQEGGAQQIYPLFVRGKLATEGDRVAAEKHIGMSGDARFLSSNTQKYYPLLRQELQRRGFTGWREKGFAVMFNSENIRSVHAAFDPKDVGDPHIGKSTEERLLSVLERLEKLFDEDLHPRDDSGRFTFGGGAGFVSPNVETNKDFSHAASDLASARQTFLRNAFADVDQTMGITPDWTHDVVGAWTDGAENSAMMHFGSMSWEDLRTVMAMKGYLANQKQVLAFQARDTNAPDFLAQFAATGNVKDIHDKLLADGLEFHTLQPTSTGAQVYVYHDHTHGPAQDVVDKLVKAAKHYGTAPEIEFGKGEFIGADKDLATDAFTREHARKVFEGIIESSGMRSAKQSWPVLRDRWRAVADAVKALSRFYKYSDDQARDDHGRWSAEGSGYTSNIDVTNARFKTWFGDSKVTNAQGDPLVMFHGTTHNFDTFDAGKFATAESFFGRGHYFTSDPNDASKNYGSKEGPDLKNRIENLAERLQNENPEKYPGGADAARAEAERQLSENEGAVIPAYIKVENPFDFGGPNETFLDYEGGYNPKTEEYDLPESGKLVDFMENLRQVARDYNDANIDKVSTKIMEYGLDGGIKASQLFNALEQSESFNYATDDEGNLVSKEIFRQALERTGFDGVIIRDPADKYPGMQIDTDAIHVIAFKSNQIKSAIGNSGRFDPNDPNITKSFNPEQEREPAGSPEGGRFASGGGGVDAGNAALHPDVVNVGGDKWNKDTAVRLERQYQEAKPALAAIEASAVGKDVQVGAPGSWDDLSGGQQETTEEKWKDANNDKYYQSEVDNYYSGEGGASYDAHYEVASKFNSGDEHEWASDALDTWRAEREDKGLPEVPFDNDTLLNAMSIPEEGDSKFDLEINNEKLGKPEGWLGTAEGQPSFPGIDEKNPALALTGEMRNELSDVMEGAFDSRVEDRTSEQPPPDYIGEQSKESLDMAWNEMSDEQKYEGAKQYDSSIEDEGHVAGLDKLPTNYDPLNAPYGERDPLNQSSGAAQEHKQDYQRTQALATFMSQQRAADLLVERGFVKDREAALALVRDADNKLWQGWVGSSTGNNGLILQAAASEELGGHINLRHMPETLEGIKIHANTAELYAKIGGFDGAKALVRAKWETSQYLLDKAGINTVDVYRGITPRSDYSTMTHSVNVSSKYFDAQAPDDIRSSSTVFAKLPNFKLERNGLASTSMSAGVSNNWGSDNRVVFRFSVPRTAVVSLPAYGKNHANEREVVIAGTAWKTWDAWSKKAPTFEQVPMVSGVHA